MTCRDRTERFKELRSLYQPHSIKIKDISTYFRSAASNISHRANAKFSKSKLAQKLKIQEPYNSDDSQEGKSLLKKKNSSKKSSKSSSYDLSSSDDDDDEYDEKKPKLPPKLIKALQNEPRWLQLLHDIDENISNIQTQC